MTERRFSDIPGSSGEYSPAMWQLDDEDVPIALDILRHAGADLGAPDIAQALADVRPATLSPETIELLDEKDRRQYLYEQEVLLGPECGYGPTP